MPAACALPLTVAAAARGCRFFRQEHRPALEPACFLQSAPVCLGGRGLGLSTSLGRPPVSPDFRGGRVPANPGHPRRARRCFIAGWKIDGQRWHICSMGAGWKFVGEFKRGRKASLSLECIVALSDRRAAEGIASKKLVGADTITATELSQAELNTLNIMEGDVRL